MNISIYKNHDYLKLIPAKKMDKQPKWRDWQSRPVDADWFIDDPEHNIGVLLGENGNNIVDVDLDHPTAVKLAPMFLPDTEMKFGRSSSPDSHWIYEIEHPGKTQQFSIGTHGMLVEYRATGGFTIFPGSVHESGETVEFSCCEEPKKVLHDDLLKAIGKLSAAVVLVENWHKSSRHKLALSLSGMLLKSGWSEAEISIFIKIICDAANDCDISDRLDALKTSSDHFNSGKSVSGYSSLAECIDEQSVSKITKWLGISCDNATSSFSNSNLAQTPESETDLGNAHRFVQKNKDRCFYHQQIGEWHYWNDSVWKKVGADKIKIMAHETANSIFSEAGTNSSLARWAHSSCSGTRLSAMVTVARPYLTKQTDELNRDPFLFNCENGILDLKTGRLRDHNRHDFVTEAANVRYDPKAVCPKFKKFINEIFEGDTELIEYVQSAMGHCLTGDASLQKMFIFYGNGANGKGTLVETIKSIFGDYAKTSQADTLMQRSKASGSQASPDIARLVDARAVFLSEGDRSHKLDEALVKQMTGQDTLTARQLYKEPFEFKPKFKLIFSTNYLPKIRGTDEGIWRRMAPIPFNASFTGSNQNPYLGQELLSEKSGILNWMLEGCLNCQKNGLIEPTAVTNAKRYYRSESDNILRFIEQETIEKSGAVIGKSNFYKAYKNWVDREGEHYTATSREFAEIVSRQQFIREKRTSSERQWEGVELRDSTLTLAHTFQ